MFKVVVSGGAGVSIEIFSEIPPLSDEPGLAGDVLNLLIASGESVIGLVWSKMGGLVLSLFSNTSMVNGQFLLTNFSKCFFIRFLLFRGKINFITNTNSV